MTELIEKYLDTKREMFRIYFYNLLLLHKKIKSPIEKLFFLEWHFRELFNDQNKYDLIPQYQDKTTGKYHLDFALIGNNKMIGIEIDGHDFHEKTKEQVRLDKKRERFLILKKWKILRFTGSEAYKDPSKCIQEVLDIIKE